jgi:hypothetical protein
MSKPLSEFGDETWDRFFDWIYDEVEPLTDEEVRRQLDQAGIDTGPAAERLRALIDPYRPPAGP